MPPSWPQPHPYAQDFDTFWVVRQLPPAPWPALPPGPVDTQLYGPPGTEWLFSVSDYLNRLTEPLVAQALGSAAKVLTDEARAVAQPLSTTWGWRTPETAPDLLSGAKSGVPMAIRCVRAVIHAKLGTTEEVAHVLHFRTQPAPDVDQQASDLVSLGGQLGTLWQQFLTTGVTPYGQGAPVRDYLPKTLVYDEIRLSYMSFAPGVKPVYLVPTQFVAMPANCNGNGTAATLPYEVAMALSLGTHLRGPRHRGRLYLGPFTSAVMAGIVQSGGTNQPAPAALDGMFSGVQNAIGQAFGEKFVAPVKATTGVVLNVLSQKGGESYEVTGVRAGQVPDSQRRRRRSLLEAYAQAWGTAPGT